jgi:tryptophan 2,3-dioxygenase
VIATSTEIAFVDVAVMEEPPPTHASCEARASPEPALMICQRHDRRQWSFILLTQEGGRRADRGGRCAASSRAADGADRSRAETIPTLVGTGTIPWLHLREQAVEPLRAHRIQARVPVESLVEKRHRSSGRRVRLQGLVEFEASLAAPRSDRHCDPSIEGAPPDEVDAPWSLWYNPIIVTRKPTAYWDYIKVDELLSLQGGLEKDDAGLANDEVLFITVHQIDELWFKLVLRELVTVRNLFAKSPVPEQALASAGRGIRRMTRLLEHVAAHFEVMETMTTRDYLAFRDKLNPASGFQSGQLREIEVLLGLSDADRIPLGHEHSYMNALKNHDGSPSSAYLRVAARLEDKPTLVSAVLDWLYRTPIQGSTPGMPGDDEKVAAFVAAYSKAHEKSAHEALAIAKSSALTASDAERLEKRYAAEIEGARAYLRGEDAPEPDRKRVSRHRAALVFIESYRELPLLAWPRVIIDELVAFEQAFVIFRQRHARMVERVIGRRTGTGGSSGVDYLDQTALRYRIFRDVWAVRTLLVRQTELPPLESAETYGFVIGS